MELRQPRHFVVLAEAMHFGHAVAAGRAGVVDVGFTGTLLFRGLAPILKSFRESFPQIEPSVRQLASQVQIEMLRAGRLDAAFPGVVALVAAGMGVSLMPESVGRLGIPGAVFVPLRGVAREATAFMAWNERRDVPGLQNLVVTVQRTRHAHRRAR
jgi:DNA-binding transcriptional LysR family regulator